MFRHTIFWHFKNESLLAVGSRKKLLSYSSSLNYSFNNDETKSLPSHARIVIAGAGTVANSVAYHLVLKGWTDVIVLEQNKIGTGTSHFGSGFLGLLRPLSHRNLISYSNKLYRQLQDMGHDVGFRQTGSLNLAQSKDRMIYLKRRVAYNLPTGLRCKVNISKFIFSYN